MRLRGSLVRCVPSGSSIKCTELYATAQPHSSVSDFTLYKHIDPEVSESQRARQLLVWSAHRALTAPTSSSSRSTLQAKDPPPKLNSEGVKILEQVQERIIRMLREKSIDTSAHSDETSTKPSTQVKANEQNVMNRNREEKFLARIDRYVHLGFIHLHDC